MGDDKTSKKQEPEDFWAGRRGYDDRHSQWAGEQDILDLISQGAPLPGILNTLCTVIDIHIGNVVSLVSLPDDEENYLDSITRSARRAGLKVFSSTGILSRNQTLLGTFDVYGCDSRRPTAHESRLIDRVSRLAAIALQRDKKEEGFERLSRRSSADIGGAPRRPPFIN